MLSFSPDGTRILSDSDRGVYVLDATSGETIAGPLIVDGKKGDKGNEEEALSAAYLPDGRYIVVATTNGIILKWDVLTSCLVSERMHISESNNGRNRSDVPGLSSERVGRGLPSGRAERQW